MKMRSLYYAVSAVLCMSLFASCGILGKKKGKGSILPNDGQVHGIAPGNKYTLPKPPGMVYIPQGTFHMGPSDEDPAFAFSARNRSVSISGFWMDATEITNNEYRQFVYWVRDSVVARNLGYVKAGADGEEHVDWTKMKTINTILLRQIEVQIGIDNSLRGRRNGYKSCYINIFSVFTRNWIFIKNMDLKFFVGIDLS